MGDHTASDLDFAIDEFKATLRSCTRRAVCSRDYILVTEFTDWLKGETSPSSGTTRVGRLLRAAYRNHMTSVALPIHVEQIDRGPRCSLLVFSILLELGLGHLVHLWRNQSIVDKSLPIDLYALKQRIERVIPSREDVESIAERFDRLQWRFCPAKFQLQDGQDYVKNQIIPICRKELINTKGGTANLWQIVIQEEFVEEELRKAVPSSRFKDPKDGLGICYEFALKSFKEGNKGLFDSEMSAFNNLLHCAGMVKCLAYYEHEEPSTSAEIEASVTRTSQMTANEQRYEATYNLILEYGDSDLDEFFAERLPPVLQPEIEKFWEAIFAVPYAVAGIHEGKINTAGVSEEFEGCHADIKPDNILSVQGKFKLADLGFAKFVKKEERYNKTFLDGGTEAFGPPECHPGRLTLITDHRTVDIWSLGCVLSIAATWVVFGYQGIKQYQKLRQIAIQKSFDEQPPQNLNRKSPPDGADYFHDRQHVLKDVTSWHDILRSTLRKSDKVTAEVLDLVDNHMLRDFKDRIQARDLCKRLDSISTHSKKTFQPLPDSIKEALREIDEGAPSRLPKSVVAALLPEDDHTPTTFPDRKAHKSFLLGLPLMKTTHRSECLNEALDRSGAPEIIYESPVEDHDSISDRPLSQGSSAGSIQPLSPIYRGSPSPPTNIQTPPNRSLDRHYTIDSMLTHTTREDSQTKAPKKIQYQNVFQARTEIEKRPKPIFDMRSKRKKKDGVLAQHFDNRDIVFLVDNAETMMPHWDEATQLLEILVQKAQYQDENGMDLMFTVGNGQVQNSNDSKQFKKEMEDPKNRPGLGKNTDMKMKLGRIFHQYLEEVKRFRIVKNLTLIILTDGIWEGVGNKFEVEAKIVDFVKQFIALKGSLLERPVSIQFIQFGSDADATSRLQRLDNDLKYSGIPDIVDTEPSLGNVNKMLLSFVEEYDEGEPNSAEPPTSLTQTPSSPPTMSQRVGSQYSARPLPNPPLTPERTPRTSPPNLNRYQAPAQPQFQSLGQPQYQPSPQSQFQDDSVKSMTSLVDPAPGPAHQTYHHQVRRRGSQRH